MSEVPGTAFNPPEQPMSSPATEVFPVLSPKQRTEYFDAIEREQADIARLLLQKLREEVRNPGNPPRRILDEVAAEGEYPIQKVQQVLWALETRGQIRWQNGQFVPTDRLQSAH
jgi:hypothetical protein